MKQEFCPNKTELLASYQQATAVHAEAVSRLQALAGISTKAKYQLLFQESQDAREAVSVALRNLETHVAEHGC